MCGSSIRRMAFVIRTLFLINGSFSTPKKNLLNLKCASWAHRKLDRIILATPVLLADDSLLLRFVSSESCASTRRVSWKISKFS